MKSLKSRLKKHEVTITNTDWNKYDDRLMKAVERGEVDKLSATLLKKGVVPTKLNVEGQSAFHLAASRGHLDCLNIMLAHHVDVTAADATGKNALHLAARNGQSLCVQKLLQHNCPVGNVDLQGRTALHDAVIAGCTSSVKLLCDSGASVDAKDFDGRTPLVLATQMCHPKICQLLLDHGADISARDKQSKTALILGCEYSCRDAVELLLKRGADVTMMDSLGHDAYHYARLCKNSELLSMVKAAYDNANKAKEATKKGQQFHQVQSVENPHRMDQVNAEAEANLSGQMFQELEVENEDLKSKLRKFHQEQRVLLDKVNGLQQQLSQEKRTVEELQKEREQLKLLLTAKDKEQDESVKAVEALKIKLKNYEGDHVGQSGLKRKDHLLTKQSRSFDVTQLQSVARPLELSGAGPAFQDENENLKKDMEVLRKRYEAAKEDQGRLQKELLGKIQECKSLSEKCETTKQDSDKQVREMEDALNDVQKRMVDSEMKVKQLQAYVVAVKEHLNNQVVDDLKEQLQDVKGKYEGASAEVGKLRNHLKLNEKALEEYKKSEGRLAEDMEKVQKELSKLKREKEQATMALMDIEGQMKELEAKLASTVPGEKFDNMKNLLTDAVDEKEGQIAELREDYERALEDIAEIQKELDRHVTLEEYDRLKTSFEDQAGGLKKKLADVTAKSQTLIKEVEKKQQENQLLKKQLQDLTVKIQAQYVPLKSHEEVKKSLSRTTEELNRKLSEVTQKHDRARAEMEKLQLEKVTLCEKVTHLQAQYVPPEKFEMEVTSLSSQKESLKQELEELDQKYNEREKEMDKLISQNADLKQKMETQFVPKELYKESRNSLGNALERTNRDLSKLEKQYRETQQEFKKVKDENTTLREKLQVLEKQLCHEYVSLNDHEAMRNTLNSTVSELQRKVMAAESGCQKAQEEAVRLHKEIEEQKKELDTIQEAIQSKFVPVTVVEERQRAFDATLKDLRNRLTEVQERLREAKLEGDSSKQDNEKLKVQIVSVQQSVETGYVPSAKHQEIENAYKRRTEELTSELGELARKHEDVAIQKKMLEEENTKCRSGLQALQHRMQTEYVLQEQFKTMQQSLNGTIEQLKNECEKTKVAYRHESEKVRMLQKELEVHNAGSVALEEHVRMKENLEGEVADLKSLLKKEEERMTEKMQQVLTLQRDLQSVSRALEQIKEKEGGELLVYRSAKSALEAEVIGLNERLSSLTEKYEELCEEVLRAKDKELTAKTESETKQANNLSIEREIKELKGRYDESLTTSADLQKRIQESVEQMAAKDKKITELLNDMERLKQALKLAHASNTPTKRQNQQVETLQTQIKSLQQQLADAERRHIEVVSVYRTHLLSAAQGHMDEDVQAALLQIIRMRQEFVC
ncbi:uveal autoantigen with coiled-coil domains and ankyrin repeats-like isoform X1 [Polyodon spathula]|uniref:uveal autoantigen with coiled-coil domains and ankyrin repeats-like isoform X1 n=2 Tax=Polyodon spathula TaxID=7913 RepID=UPI001B7DF793|nr:uveal autoantigen with coiled-coil domains and ankyrin repeats-like isoform X1 [Polyodon spathula]